MIIIIIIILIIILLSSKNLCNDSYGDNIINDLNKFRKLALEESSISNYKK